MENSARRSSRKRWRKRRQLARRQYQRRAATAEGVLWDIICREFDQAIAKEIVKEWNIGHEEIKKEWYASAFIEPPAIAPILRDAEEAVAARKAVPIVRNVSEH